MVKLVVKLVNLMVKLVVKLVARQRRFGDEGVEVR